MNVKLVIFTALLLLATFAMGGCGSEAAPERDGSAVYNKGAAGAAKKTPPNTAPRF